MSNAPFGFSTAQWAIRKLPNGLKGKTRLGRLLLRLFLSWRPAYLVDVWGNRFECPSLEEPVALGIFTFGQYERETTVAILSRLPKAGVLLDVGANIGAISIPVAKQRPDVRVISVEADPNIAAILRHNILSSGINNITVVQSVIGATTEVGVPFYRAPDRQFGMGSLGRQYDCDPILIPQTTIEALLSERGISSVDVIKIDVEGGELGVLRGGEALLSAAPPPAIIFEFTDWAEARIPGQSPGDAQAFLMSRGYQLFRLEEGYGVADALLRPMTTGAAMIFANSFAAVVP